MHVILDYGVGNLLSVAQGFSRVGIDTIISKDKEVIRNAKSLILPGVGAFEDAMLALKNSGLIPLIMEHVEKKKYLIGICLGMQLLYETSYEDGVHEGLGLLKGSINYLDIDLKVPHMGWNQLYLEKKDNPILKYIKEREYVYFVHSYYVKSSNNELIAYTNYQELIPAIVNEGFIYGTQFHPEKSGETGLNLLRAYKEIIK
jgi:imidazole glycerol-phosphate synthase subunit HisH